MRAAPLLGAAATQQQVAAGAANGDTALLASAAACLLLQSRPLLIRLVCCCTSTATHKLLLDVLGRAEPKSFVAAGVVLAAAASSYCVHAGQLLGGSGCTLRPPHTVQAGATAACGCWMHGSCARALAVCVLNTALPGSCAGPTFSRAGASEKLRARRRLVAGDSWLTVSEHCNASRVSVHLH